MDGLPLVGEDDDEGVGEGPLCEFEFDEGKGRFTDAITDVTDGAVLPAVGESLNM